ncbi:hypothetical protein [Gabonibacter massiliensis]|uniref:hypothetical protein n=1 Tax=Gabonibacter massiliensis TaxID=1720195 RepID=UPI00073F1ADA|nr:hypothetical protein [Gabonibacter massiliensis]
MIISFNLEQMFVEETTFKAEKIEGGNNINCYDPVILDIANQLFMNRIDDYYLKQIIIEWEPVLRTTTKDREELAKICISNYFISSQGPCQELSDKNLNDITNICRLLFNNRDIVEQKQTEIYNTAINIYFSINPHIDIDINFESVISISVLFYFLARRYFSTSSSKRKRHSKRYYS